MMCLRFYFVVNLVYYIMIWYNLLYIFTYVIGQKIYTLMNEVPIIDAKSYYNNYIEYESMEAYIYKYQFIIIKKIYVMLIIKY